MSWLTMLYLFAGLGLLAGGAELFIRGAAGIAGRFGIPPLVIGLTVVAFGTSAPEVAVSVLASFQGQPDIAVGNVVGSNILNVLLVLGLAALMAPLVVARHLVKVDVPVMIGVTLLAWLVAADGRVGRLEGAFLVAALVAYTVLLLRLSRGRGRGVAPGGEPAIRHDPVPLQAVLVLGGLAMLVLGSRWLVAGATDVARLAGLSELTIGLTVVALGTSLPEVASSVVAALRGQRDIAVGNVVGSNVFNLLLVLGLAALVGPSGVPVTQAALSFDIPVMVAVTLACLAIFLTGYRIERWEGALLLGYYVAYTVFLVLDAQNHDAAQPFGRVMLLFVVPITVVALLGLAWRGLRARSRQTPGD